MASIDTLFDAIRTAIPTYSGFTTKKEVPNPYSLEDNSQNYLEDSWGLVIGSGARSGKDTNAFKDFRVSTERSINVVLCRAVYDVHNISNAVNTQVKNLLLDAKTIRDNFLSSSKFGVLKGGEEIVYIGDNGVNFINNEKFKLIYTQIDFTFEILETLT